MTDIPALIARLNSAIRAYEATDNGNSQACELLRDCADVIKAAHLTVSPLPAPGEAAAEAVCHDEQLEIWAGEFVDHLLAIGFAPDFETYGEKIKYFSSVKNAIKDLVEKAFTHPELEKAPVSPLPEEIAELLDLHMGLPALPLVVEPTVMDGHYWVGDTGGRTIARVEDEGVGRAIIAIPRMLAALGRMARENERLHEERETACHAAVNFSNETLRIQAERDAIKAKTIGECLMAAGNWRSRGYANAEAAIRALNPPPPATTETPS